MVDVIKHSETGKKYIIPHDDPLPSNAYVYLARDISENEAARYFPKQESKAKC